ncbi:MAG: hypothetical protein ACOCRZ_05570 [Halothermotrichaceae bacterium]
MEAKEVQLEFAGKKGRAVVVDCDKDWDFVFWEKAQYVGCVNLGNDVWFTPEWCETNSPNDLHCYEPIMDKKLKWSKVEILESGPARVRVKWSYRLNDMRYRVFHGDTRAEEIYTIYPDGIAVREVALWPGTQNNHGGNPNFWQMAEMILINGIGTGPLDVLKGSNPFELRDGNGESIDVPFFTPSENYKDLADPFCDYYSQVADWSNYIGRIRLKEIPDPFIIICKDQHIFPYVECNACGQNHPYLGLFTHEGEIATFKHWPASDMENFIGWAPNETQNIKEVATHTCFMDVNYAMRRGQDDFVPTPYPGTTWYMLVGAIDGQNNSEKLDKLAKSYHYPAEIEVEKKEDLSHNYTGQYGQVLYEGYDYSKRAYIFRKSGEEEIRFKFTPDTDKKQINPVFIIEDWDSPKVSLRVNNINIDNDKYFTQVFEGKLVIWIKSEFDKETIFEIHGK